MADNDLPTVWQQIEDRIGYILSELYFAKEAEARLHQLSDSDRTADDMRLRVTRISEQLAEIELRWNTLPAWPVDEVNVGGRRAASYAECALGLARQFVAVPEFKRLGDFTRGFSADLIEELIVKVPAELREAANSQGATRRKRNRRRATTAIPRLTGKQVEAHRLYGETEGNMTKVAKLMGVSRQVAQQHYDAANLKLGRLAGRLAKPKTQSIPRDRRGQETISNHDE